MFLLPGDAIPKGPIFDITKLGTRSGKKKNNSNRVKKPNPNDLNQTRVYVQHTVKTL